TDPPARPPPLRPSDRLAFTGGGDSSFTGVGGRVSGNMAAGQHLTIEAGTGSGPYIDMGYQAPATIAGTITLTSVSSSTDPSNTALLDSNPMNPGEALTITGTLTIDPGSGGYRQLRGLFVNQGLIIVNEDVS